MPRYFEDIEVGETYEHGSQSVTKEEIVEFAEEFDPQPFHVDEEAAEESAFGGLAASGWHTAAMCMRLLVEVMDEADWASQGARGIDALRWIRPVRPGDTLSVEVEVVEKRVDEDDPTIGHVDNELTGYNQDGDAVISWVGLGMIERRPDEG
ncbi:MaoC family dehydratase [Halorientalis salina]|uniref:MaoC family dehydratase n=1 Tax=Halorientalis salina TaxID=2932266 RepID=UPI0010ABAD8D|nr:MaoC family dehydratase [Halorientalis salina]